MMTVTCCRMATYYDYTYVPLDQAKILEVAKERYLARPLASLFAHLDAICGGLFALDLYRIDHVSHGWPG